MATADDGLYWIDIEGAAQAELRRGMEAARAVLDAAGVDPLALFTALDRAEGYAFGMLDEQTAEEKRLCRLWYDADQAAVAACCGAWRRRPTTADLSLLASVRDARMWDEVDDVADPEPGSHFDLTMPAPLELAF